MKNIFFSNLKVMSVSLLLFAFVLSSCNEEKNIDSTTTNTNVSSKLRNYGTTIPLKIHKEDNETKVAFMLSAQFYTINNNDTKNIKIIKDAIETESPIRVYLKNSTNEIALIEKLSDSQAEEFNNITFRKQENTKRYNLREVIPNENILNELFKIIVNKSCGTSSDKPCITFRYPVDGCYARAHKIREILAKYGYDCQKQFVYGYLRASTGTCCVSWNYHVAALVKFKNSKGNIETRIIDPSLFSNSPVTEEVWRKACVNSSCGSARISSYRNTPGDVYYISENATNGMNDYNYVNTNCVLNTYRNLSGCKPSPAPATGHCGL